MDDVVEAGRAISVPRTRWWVSFPRHPDDHAARAHDDLMLGVAALGQPAVTDAALGQPAGGPRLLSRP